MERFEYFAFDEVVNVKKIKELDVETRYLAILAVLLGSQAKEAFQFILSKALDKKVMTSTSIFFEKILGYLTMQPKGKYVAFKQ